MEKIEKILLILLILLGVIVLGITGFFIYLKLTTSQDSGNIRPLQPLPANQGVRSRQPVSIPVETPEE